MISWFPLEHVHFKKKLKKWKKQGSQFLYEINNQQPQA